MISATLLLASCLFCCLLTTFVAGEQFRVCPLRCRFPSLLIASFSHKYLIFCCVLSFSCNGQLKKVFAGYILFCLPFHCGLQRRPSTLSFWNKGKFVDKRRWFTSLVATKKAVKPIELLMCLWFTGWYWRSCWRQCHPCPGSRRHTWQEPNYPSQFTLIRCASISWFQVVRKGGSQIIKMEI